MNVFSKVPHAGQLAFSPLRKGLSAGLVIIFTVLTLLLTTGIVFAWEKVLRPPYYGWVARNYPGVENAETRSKFEQRGEHFFISITVDVIVVSILLALVGRQQRRLFEAHERLAHSEKIATLGRVAAQVAHEVRNPLAGLLLYSMHLKSKVNGRVSDSEAELVDKIIETINHLTSTTEQILNYARPVKLAPCWVDLNTVATDVIALLQTQISANGIETRLELADSGVAGMLDEPSIRAATLNLALNAVQAMPNGGRLTITTNSGEGKLWLAIADTGSGITPEQAEHIFEPFNTTKGRGLGLGMPYAQKIVEQHGGKISVQSQPQQGTRVRLELPAVRRSR